MNDTPSRRPRILHLRSSEFFGGPERAILGQCASMPRFEFVCGCFVRPGQESVFLERAVGQGVATVRLEQAHPLDFGVSRRLRRIVETQRIDLLVSHDYKASFFARKALRGGGVRHIRHFRGATAEDLKVKLYNAIDRFVLRRLPLVLVVSEGTRRVLEGYGVDPRAIEVVPNAIEERKLAEPGFERRVREKGAFRIVAAGRLSFEKGYDVLLEALGRLGGGTREFTVEIYGHGPERRRLEEQARRAGLGSRVRFLGFVEEILPVLREADLLVLPSRSEGMPNILLEAWAQKLGVVATAVGGVPEMIDDGVNGLLAPAEDGTALARQIRRMLDDPALAIACGEAGYERVRERYNYRAQAELLGGIYSEILDGRGKASA